MSRKLIAIVVAAGLLLLLAVPALAIVWGQPDGDAHPYVGFALFYALEDGVPVPAWSCSGSLISPTVFLTAAHCTDGAVAAWVTFDPDLTDGYPIVWASELHTHPGFNWFATYPFPNNYDIGVVILEQAVDMPGGYAQLPELDEVVDLEAAPGPPALFTIVGYGVNGILPNPTDEEDWYGMRYNAEPQLIEIGSAEAGDYYMRLSSNPGVGRGTGGSCFGDSGGPALFGGNKIAGVGSAGRKNCVGTGYYYRIDSDFALEWISGFLDGG